MLNRFVDEITSNSDLLSNATNSIDLQHRGGFRTFVNNDKNPIEVCLTIYQYIIELQRQENCGMNIDAKMNQEGLKLIADTMLELKHHNDKNLNIAIENHPTFVNLFGNPKIDRFEIQLQFIKEFSADAMLDELKHDIIISNLYIQRIAELNQSFNIVSCLKNPILNQFEEQKSVKESKSNSEMEDITSSSTSSPKSQNKLVETKTENLNLPSLNAKKRKNVTNKNALNHKSHKSQKSILEYESNNNTQNILLNDNNFNIKIKSEFENTQPIINIEKILKSLSLILQNKREGNNAEENCAHLTNYTLLALENFLYGKEAPTQPVSTEPTYNETHSHWTKDKVHIKTEEDKIIASRTRVTSAAAIRTETGLHANLPFHSTTTINLTTESDPIVSDTVDLSSDSVPYLRAEAWNLTNTLKHRAKIENGILTGHVMLVRTGSSYLSHCLTFCATEQNVYYIDAQCYDGIKHTGNIITVDEIEKMYKFAKLKYGQHKGMYSHLCFYLIHEKFPFQVENNNESKEQNNSNLIHLNFFKGTKATESPAANIMPCLSFGRAIE